MHLDTHFLKFEFLDNDNMKPFKSKFSINSKFGIQNMFFDMILKYIALFDSLNHVPNPCKMQHMNENFKLKFLDLLSIYFFITRQTGKICKVD